MYVFYVKQFWIIIWFTDIECWIWNTEIRIILIILSSFVKNNTTSLILPILLPDI